MEPNFKYVFRSAKGPDVTITTRMGEDSARSAAMNHFWGPPSGWCQNKGTGLELKSTTRVNE